MKKLLYIVVAISTFLIGIFSFNIYFLFTPVSVYGVKEIVPIGRLQQNPQLYISKKIILQENIVAFRDENYKLNYYILNHQLESLFGCFYELNGQFLACRVNNEINFINKVSENEVQLIEEIARRNGNQWESGFDNGMYVAKVEISGYLRVSDMFDNSFIIDVANIKQVSPIRFISNKEMKSTK